MPRRPDLCKLAAARPQWAAPRRVSRRLQIADRGARGDIRPAWDTGRYRRPAWFGLRKGFGRIAHPRLPEEHEARSGPANMFHGSRMTPINERKKIVRRTTAIAALAAI